MNNEQLTQLKTRLDERKILPACNCKVPLFCYNKGNKNAVRGVPTPNCPLAYRS